MIEPPKTPIGLQCLAVYGFLATTVMFVDFMKNGPSHRTPAGLLTYGLTVPIAVPLIGIGTVVDSALCEYKWMQYQLDLLEKWPNNEVQREYIRYKGDKFTFKYNGPFVKASSEYSKSPYGFTKTYDRLFNFFKI